MPNNSYIRSTKREREIVNKARAEGFDAGRTAGSHSPWDVYIWDQKTKTMRLIQVKTKLGWKMRIEKDQKVFEGCTVITSTHSWE